LIEAHTGKKISLHAWLGKKESGKKACLIWTKKKKICRQRKASGEKKGLGETAIEMAAERGRERFLKCSNVLIEVRLRRLGRVFVQEERGKNGKKKEGESSKKEKRTSFFLQREKGIGGLAKPIGRIGGGCDTQDGKKLQKRKTAW